ncbi:MAG TPA: tRNA uridine-5-carboxymethylaminomethyl(34) synthesis enzyme MnmG [candidate division Zixibacteria bacterium]|nr:tRNA uridine-5-carboxymethylaminomethyl(34) synthesis enzyme MnmG [candidate division Zixibacteria bacterium]
MISKDFDIVIIGGGHAGVEAALASARMGKSVAIITMDARKLALMSCNPAIGGIAKSHVVKEIDALGGVMGIAADASGIQFRKLNLSRGPAVWSTRVQCDRRGYNDFICDYVANSKNIEVIEALAGEILTESGKVIGIRTESGELILCNAIIVSTGTFLSGLIHIGEKKIKAGRIGENAAYKLSDSFRELGFEISRLKTGTPPRLNGDTIDWSKCEIQPGHEPIPFFSNRSNRAPFKQSPCYLTYTTNLTKEVILKNIHRSPMFSGQIKSTGPRYCPSVEDKFYRFKDKERHQLFLEPEGNGTSEIYPNGFSTSLPEEVQYAAIRTVTGLENVEITRPGYAVEYDYCPAHQIKPSLETRLVNGLFFAGQINGTSGYEEAAGQGLMAGINSVLYIENEPAFVLDRSEAYIGVMIDDLTTRSTTEPYRLFTSRAEYRLAMREDNARDRLAKYAEKYALVKKAELDSFEQIQRQTEQAVQFCKETTIPSSELLNLIGAVVSRTKVSLEYLIKQPDMTICQVLPVLAKYDGRFTDNPLVLERAAIKIRYQGYVEKQEREIKKFKKLENEAIPEDFGFNEVKGLKKEASEKFQRFRPSSLGQAGRIEGVTPGDVAVLSVYLKRFKALMA